MLSQSEQPGGWEEFTAHATQVCNVEVASLDGGVHNPLADLPPEAGTTWQLRCIVLMLLGCCYMSLSVSSDLVPRRLQQDPQPSCCFQIQLEHSYRSLPS